MFMGVVIQCSHNITCRRYDRTVVKSRHIAFPDAHRENWIEGFLVERKGSYQKSVTPGCDCGEGLQTVGHILMRYRKNITACDDKNLLLGAGWT